MVELREDPLGEGVVLAFEKFFKAESAPVEFAIEVLIGNLSEVADLQSILEDLDSQTMTEFFAAGRVGVGNRRVEQKTEGRNESLFHRWSHGGNGLFAFDLSGFELP